jgi:hypothetical protein
MKSLLLILLLVSAVISRENPFIPTKAYIEKKAEKVETFVEFKKKNEQIQAKPTKKIVLKKTKQKISKNTTQQKNKDVTLLCNGIHNLFSFVILQSEDSTLTITTQNQLLKRFDYIEDDGTKKIVFDFIGSQSFYTKRAKLISKNFKFIKIGAHPNDGYFRIAITVSKHPAQYDVLYEDKKIIISNI